MHKPLLFQFVQYINLFISGTNIIQTEEMLKPELTGNIVLSDS